MDKTEKRRFWFSGHKLIKTDFVGADEVDTYEAAFALAWRKAALNAGIAAQEYSSNMTEEVMEAFGKEAEKLSGVSRELVHDINDALRIARIMQYYLDSGLNFPSALKATDKLTQEVGHGDSVSSRYQKAFHLAERWNRGGEYWDDYLLNTDLYHTGPELTAPLPNIRQPR